MRMLEINNINKKYNSVFACKNISLEIIPNEFFFILGPSGCGKTTLLKIIAGLIEQDSGTIILEDNNITTLPANERPFNMVFQDYSLFPHLSVFNNIAFGLKMKKVSKDEIELRVNETLKLLKIYDLADRKPNEISGGQQQRVALARAIVNKPSILLLDEPLSALDEKLRFEMQQILLELKNKINSTFIFVTHSQDEALSMADRIAIMQDGKIVQIDTPKNIYNKPINLFVAEFMGEINKIETDNKVSLIRPENILISNKLFDKKNIDFTTSGVITQLLFKGNNTSVLVKLENDLRIKVLQPSNSLNNLLIGDNVFLGWNKKSLMDVEQ